MHVKPENIVSRQCLLCLEEVMSMMDSSTKEKLFGPDQHKLCSVLTV